MSKRSEEATLKAYPNDTYFGGRSAQRLFREGYERAVSDVLSWLDSNMTLGPGDTSELKSEIKAHFL